MMNKKITIYGVMVLCVAGAVLGLMLTDQQQQLAILDKQKDVEEIYENIPKLPPTDISIKSAMFVNSTGGVLQVYFDNTNNVAMVNANGQGDVIFTETTSASGAKYENKTLDMVLWNKGDMVTLYQKGAVVFEGVSK